MSMTESQAYLGGNSLIGSGGTGTGSGLCSFFVAWVLLQQNE